MRCVARSSKLQAAASILSPVAFGLALNIVATLESNGVGIKWATAYSQVNGTYTFADALGWMFFDFLLYTFLALYLGKVLPQEFGVPLPWYFPFTRRFWRDVCSCFRCGGGAGDSATGPTDAALAKQSLLSHEDGAEGASTAPITTVDGRTYTSRYNDIGLATSDKIEAPGIHLRELARNGRTVSIRGLSKHFDTPDGKKVAVDDLSLDMFEGQIFALLGHNVCGCVCTHAGPH
ncbi:MAG: hypothetical protein EOO65_05270, partial [Methanosarcinales archaeon]